MSRRLKLFCTPEEQQQLSSTYPVIEHYDAFVIIEAPERDVDSLRRKFPLDDITDQYRIVVDNDIIDTAQPRVDAKGKQRAHPAYRGVKRLTEKPHHYLVQFKGPVKAEWLDAVQQAGGDLRTPFADFAYVVRATPAAFGAIAALHSLGGASASRPPLGRFPAQAASAPGNAHPAPHPHATRGANRVAVGNIRMFVINGAWHIRDAPPAKVRI